MGFSGTDAVVEIDLGHLDSISSIETNFLVYPAAWIMFTNRIKVYTSKDRKNWKQQIDSGNLNNSPANEVDFEFIMPATLDFETVQARYVKFVAENYGKLPHWHEAAGSDAWIFMDEIIVR